MCYLISIAISPRNAAEAAKCFSQHHFDVAQNHNRHVCRAFGPDKVVLDIACGGCSCSFYAERSSSLDDQQERRRYERRGWPSSKIERALEQKRRPHENQPRDFDRFQAAIRACVTNLGQVSLLSHVYCEKYSVEPVEVRASLLMPLRQFELEGGVFPQDTILTLT